MRETVFLFCKMNFLSSFKFSNNQVIYKQFPSYLNLRFFITSQLHTTANKKRIQHKSRMRSNKGYYVQTLKHIAPFGETMKCRNVSDLSAATGSCRAASQ